MKDKKKGYKVNHFVDNLGKDEVISMSFSNMRTLHDHIDYTLKKGLIMDENTTVEIIYPTNVIKKIIITDLDKLK